MLNPASPHTQRRLFTRRNRGLVFIPEVYKQLEDLNTRVHDAAGTPMPSPWDADEGAAAAAFRTWDGSVDSIAGLISSLEATEADEAAAAKELEAFNKAADDEAPGKLAKHRS